jgi:hypothetical protein
MSGSLLAVILIPVAAAIGLAVWLTTVLHASLRPQGTKAGTEPGQAVVGGVFRGDPRQQMPRREVPAEGRTTANTSTSTAREEDQR